MIYGEFDLPTIEYFINKNIYIGSLGEFQYKLEPSGDELKAFVWHGILCFEKSDVACEATFPLEPDGSGLLKAIEWLKEKRKEPMEQT